MKLGFAYRIALVLALALVAGTALTSILNLHKFERILADMLTSRFEFVVSDLRGRIETQMDLGLALENLESLNDELDALLIDDEQILSIEIINDNGTVVFSTDPSFVGDLVAEDWIFTWQVNRPDATWSMLEADAGVVGAGLQNNLNQNVGSIALRYSREFLDQSVLQQVERLMLIAAVVAIVVIALSVMGCILLLRGHLQDWKIMREALADIRSRNRGSASLLEANSRHPEFEGFSDAAFDAMDSIDSATGELRRLDEEAE